MRGCLISFEGGDGAGKSTLIRELARILKKEGYSVSVTREPGGSPLAEKIRSLIIRNSMSPLTELFLYEASRNEHMRQTILPALSDGQIVLCDRFADSSLAYQSAGRGIPWKTVQMLNQVATEGLKPTASIFLDSDAGSNLKRATKKNRFEREGVSFQEKVRRGFRRAIRENPRRWIQIRARSGSPQEMARDLADRLRSRLKKVRKNGDKK